MQMFRSAILLISCANLHKEIFSLHLVVWFAALQGCIRQLFRNRRLGANRVLQHGEAFWPARETTVCLPCCKDLHACLYTIHWFLSDPMLTAHQFRLCQKKTPNFVRLFWICPYCPANMQVWCILSLCFPAISGTPPLPWAARQKRVDPVQKCCIARTLSSDCVCQEIAELKSKTGANFLAINQYQYGISAKFMHVAQ
jgi:hypothetical protein